MDLHQWDWCDISRIFSLPSVWTSVVRITWVSPAEHLNRWGWDGAREERSKSADSNAKYTYAQDTVLLCYFGGRLFESFLVTRAKLFVFKWREERSFPGGSVVKNPPGNPGDTEDMGLIPELGKSPGEGNDKPLQYCCLGNFMGRGTLLATGHGVTKSQTWLRDWACRDRGYIKSQFIINVTSQFFMHCLLIAVI